MKRLIVFSILIFILSSGCEENEILSPEKQISQINMNITGLQSLGDTARYGAWVVYDSANTEITICIGAFGVDEQGEMSNKVFDVNMGYLQKAQGILISIEENDTLGANPSNYRILAAKVIANNGTFSIGDDYLLDFDFSNSTATYLLDTPTDPTNPKSGLWFVNKDTSGQIICGLDLPDLPANWTYEGWVDFNGTPVSTGKFTSVESADTSIYGAGSPGYAFPGENFLSNAPEGLTFPTDLSGKQIYITIEPPYPKYSNCPFTVKAFTATIPTEASADTIYEMENNSSTFPNGDLSIDINLFD